MKLLSRLIASAFLALLAKACVCLAARTNLETEVESEVSLQEPEQHEEVHFISREPLHSEGEGIADEAHSEENGHEGSAIGDIENESSPSTYEAVVLKERGARKAALRSLAYSIALLFGTVIIGTILTIVDSEKMIKNLFPGSQRSDEFYFDLSFGMFLVAVSQLIVGVLGSLGLLGAFVYRLALWFPTLQARLNTPATKTAKGKQNRPQEEASGVPLAPVNTGATGGADSAENR